MELTAPHEVAVVTAANRLDAAMPKRVSFALHVAPCLVRRGRLVDLLLRNQRVAALLIEVGRRGERHQQHEHRRQQHPALARVSDHAAEGVGQRERNDDDRQHSSRFENGVGFS